MTDSTGTSPSSLTGRFADAIASTESLPTALRSVFGYYSDTGVFDYGALKIKRYVDRTVEEMLSDAFGAIEKAIADTVGEDPSSIEFSYETKLTMPAELTLGRIYQRAIAETPDAFNPVTQRVKTPLAEYFRIPFDKEFETKRIMAYREEYTDTLDEIDHAERMTELVIEALLDGDMRDAINDNEYEDFEITGPIQEVSLEEIARVAQQCLAMRVEEKFNRFSDSVREAYEHAVEVSERHQEDDARFREIAEAAATDGPTAEQRIREEYKQAKFDDKPSLFSTAELGLPYLKTQYDRVGVIYDGMIEMYREAGIEIDTGFKKSIVLAIIGAQIWLDDIDDFEQDLAEGQLTPVTAEYWLANSEPVAFEQILDITVRYLDLARRFATESNSTLTGIAIEYILLSGEPETLPGSNDGR